MMKVYLFLLMLSMMMITFSKQQSTYRNSVLPGENSPDPGVILHDSLYYVVTTSNLDSERDAFPMHVSSDLVNWKYNGHMFPNITYKPKWASDDFWAPEIHINNGKFRLYYTARDRESQILCIGVAVSDNIAGPYVDIGLPLIKNMSVGSIDATVYHHDENTHFLIWKDDGNDPRWKLPTWIWMQQLSPDGLSVIGRKYPLIRNTLSWEGDLVEGPWMIYHNSTYFLFYSANNYCNDQYTLGVARSKSLIGPYTKREQPLVHSNSEWIGPGHCSVVPKKTNKNEFVLVYHSWHKGEVCGGNNRLLLVDSLLWDDQGWPYIPTDSPSIGPQPVPLN
jgi:arabinan endo-1,5-alpha-L-arabinosidase